jgi:glucose/arabinose dehydrogenase
MENRLLKSFTCILLFNLMAGSFFSIVAQQNKNSLVAKDSSNSRAILPKPYATKSAVNNPNVTGWTEGKTPIAPTGFKVSKFADGFHNPRWIYAGPNGDLFICEVSTSPSSANQITILRDSDKDGKYDLREIFLSNQNKPFGMLV